MMADRVNNNNNNNNNNNKCNLGYKPIRRRDWEGLGKGGKSVELEQA
jgi:hypothetical protein